MNIRVWISVLALVTCSGQALAQPSRIDEPDEFSSTPVHVTRPVEGQVEVTNLPAVQDVRVIGGTLEGPVEVLGEVGLRVEGPMPVEVVNPSQVPAAFQVEGTVRVDDAQPLRVWVENPPEPAERPRERQFATYSFRGAFSSKDSTVRRSFRAPYGVVFHLTDLVIDARPDAVLKVRLVAPEGSVAGSVAGSARGEIPLTVLDVRNASSVRLGTAVPLAGEFSLEVEAIGPGQGTPFWVVAYGYLESSPT